MNLILLDPESTLDAGQYALTDRQQTHVTKVIKAQAGDVLRVGVLNGKIGDGVYEPPSGDQSGYIHSLNLSLPAPDPLPLTLVMALPRPNMLKRTLQNITAMGVKELYLIHSSKVEKSYWQSRFYKQTLYMNVLCKGLNKRKTP